MVENLFIFIADSWGVEEGGINSFNYDLSLACARLTKLRKNGLVCCIAPNLSQKACDDIKRDGILPITLQEEDFNSDQAALIIIKRLKLNARSYRMSLEHCNIFVIGHDIYTGGLAKQCAIASNGWCIIFHHMDYASYYLLKNSNIDEYNNKTERQKLILCEADLVCAVGPKLKNSAEDIVRVKNELEVLEVTPGVAEFTPIEKVSKRFNPIVFGRVEESNQKVKQISLAIGSYARAIAKDKEFHIIGEDSRLYVIGYKREDNEYLKQEVQRLNKEAEIIAGKMCNIIPFPYISERKKLEDKITEASVAMMLSFHEGFGLVGYEAIAAGIPVIISENTGLYIFLKERNLSNYVYSVKIEGSHGREEGYSDRDLETVSTALLTIRKDEAYYKQRALELRNILRFNSEEYSWNGVANKFVEHILRVFRDNLRSMQNNFLHPQEVRLLEDQEYHKGVITEYIKDINENHVFKVIGKGAFYSLIRDLSELYSHDEYEILIYNVLSETENKSDIYEYFVADCQDYFDPNNSASTIMGFVENEFANRLSNTILVLNHFPENPSSYFDALFSVLEESKEDFRIFVISDIDDSVPIQLKPYTKKEAENNICVSSVVSNRPSLSKEQQALVKILSFFKRAYTKKIFRYICRVVNLDLIAFNSESMFTNTLDDEDMFYKVGLIEEYSEYSCQNTKLLYDMASEIEIDNVVYSLGIFELGRYYARCYRFGRNQDAQLNWGVFSCQCYKAAMQINPKLREEIKTKYEAILIDMRIKCMRTAQYERYIRLLQDFIDIFTEPDNMWIWYNLLHCQSICEPRREILNVTKELLLTKITKLNFDEQKNVDLYMQFIRLCAELENDLGCDRVVKNLMDRQRLVSGKKIGIVIHSQYITTLIAIAIDQGEYVIAADNIERLKELKEYPYSIVNSCALEMTLEMIKYEKGITKVLSGDQSRLEKAYEMACYIINDNRSQSWISGFLGEYLILKGDPDGEKKIKHSLTDRKRSGERTKSYRNWLIRVHSLNISSELREYVQQEMARTGVVETKNDVYHDN